MSETPEDKTQMFNETEQGNEVIPGVSFEEPDTQAGEQAQRINYDGTETASDRHSRKLDAEKAIDNLLKAYGFNQEEDSLVQAGRNVQEQWKAVDEIVIRAINSRDISKMHPDEVTEHKERLDKRIAIYNAIARYSLGLINPYKIEVKISLKQARKLRDELERSIDDFNYELMGRAKPNGNSELYTRVLENLPEAIKDNPQFTEFIKGLEQNSTICSGENGLKKSVEKSENAIRGLLNMDDVLQAMIAEYKEKTETLSTKIKELTKQIASNPRDSKLLNNRTEKIEQLSTYEKERDRYMDIREQVFDKYDLLEREHHRKSTLLGSKKVIILETKDKLRFLDNNIKSMESLLTGENDARALAVHLEMVDRAEETGKRLFIPGIVGETILAEQLQAMTNKRNPDAGSYRGPDTDWGSMADARYSQIQERMAKRKSEIQNRIY